MLDLSELPWLEASKGNKKVIWAFVIIPYLEEVSGVPPHVDPEPQKSTSDHREEDGHQDVDEEREKCPGHDDQPHQDDGKHILKMVEK